MVKHGMDSSPEYRTWISIRYRCSNKDAKDYARYGGRGIRVCERWDGSFENFYADMGPRPSPDHTIEREDNDKDYCPGNCVWALMVVQQNNKRNTRYVVYKGERMGLGMARRLSGSPIGHATITYRLLAGWDLEEALLTPVGALPREIHKDRGQDGRFCRKDAA